MNVWFTSDLHLGHSNIIRLAGRPYTDVIQMDEALVANWNSRVGRDDRVYLLGDLSFHRPEITRDFVRRLHGEIHLIVGNHDERTVRKIPDAFASVEAFSEIKLWDQHITLCHYALRVWSRSHYGALSLYGHSHGNLEPYGRSMDVGVDSPWVTGIPEYRPFSFEEVLASVSQRDIELPDHHGRD
jgi:calcineurin-like phosphoesterase family protein